VIHTAKDGRKWAPIQFGDGVHIIGKDGSLGKNCVGLSIFFGVDYVTWHEGDNAPGDGRPLCPACCRAAIRLGLLEDPAPGRVLKKRRRV